MNTWRQTNVEVTDWEQAEARLTPLLSAAEREEAFAPWFFIRKRPCWRIRHHGRLDVLIAEGTGTAWTETVYEPEVHAFGGTEAMASAHHFFHRDSRSVIAVLQSDAAGHRREISLMLCGLMMRSAGLDWYEQGDVWARVGEHRARPGPDSRLLPAVHRLISVNAEDMMGTGGQLAHLAEWADAYADAGREVGRLASSGLLHRGLRDVLAHHVLFAWNRIGLSYETQAAIAFAARTVIFGPDPGRSAV